ncbi:MAG: SCO family protein [Steroidobacteraceae bacterium]|jgi:protein SCO1/2
MSRSTQAVALRALPGALLLAGWLALSACAPATPPPAPFNSTEVEGLDYGLGVNIPDTSGVLREIKEFRGQVALVFFGFASCPDVCPTTLFRLREVRDALGDQAGGLQVILVTVDPERDTPERLQAYVENFDPSFLGLRPEPENLERIVEEFRAIAIKVPDATGESYTIDHSATLYIYDRQSRLRLIAQPSLEVANLATDIKRLILEDG